jgi:vacuolar-type H+-ATPase subunit I/STV1
VVKNKYADVPNDEPVVEPAEYREIREVVQPRRNATQIQHQVNKNANLEKIRNLKKDLLAYEREKRELKRKYTTELEQIKKLRQTKENKKLYEIRIKRDVEDKKKLKEKYNKLFDYIRKNELNPDDLTEVEEYMQEHEENIITGRLR